MKEIEKLDEIMHRVDRVYDRYARSIGSSNSALYLLSIVYHRGSCTQRELTEFMMLPKQTVNSIVKEYEQQGILELSVSEQDRRQRSLHLTAAGLETARRYIPAILRAEERAMEQFTPEERIQLLDLLERYAGKLEIEMKG